MSRLPIRVRVVAAFALAMAIVLTGSGLFLYARLSTHLLHALDGQLQLRSQDLAVLVAQPHASLALEGRGRFIEVGESYAQLISSNGRVLEATPALRSVPLLDASQLRAATHAPIYVDAPSLPGLNESSRMLATTVRHHGRSDVLVVGATLQNRAETLALFRRELLVAGPVALLFACVVGYLLAGLSLRQVESMRRRAALISAETLSGRLPVPHTGDELERLATTLNEMLDGLEAALERERSFVADAGHELRTPLAVLRTELELALHHASSIEELRDAVGRSSEEADRLSQLAEDLLLMARADRGSLALRIEELDVGSLLATVLSRVEWRAAAQGSHVRFELARPLRMRGDRLRLEQALTNIVDNALRYGGDGIVLAAREHEGYTELQVRDTGAGFPPDFIDQAFDRFSRAAHARGRSGAGLGLAIVQSIAAAHGGRAYAENLGSEGAHVSLRIPRDA